MIELLVTFAPVAAVLSVAPGVATALVVKNAAVGGRRDALRTTVAFLVIRARRAFVEGP